MQMEVATFTLELAMSVEEYDEGTVAAQKHRQKCHRSW